MNLSALARSLSNSLRFAVGSRKHLDTSPTESEISSIQANATPSETTSRSTRNPTEEDALKQKPSTKAVAKVNKRREPYKETVEQILDKVSELEHTLYEDQQQEFKLRMALERQTERIHELNFSLDTEKQRNERLVQLLRGVDSDSSNESEPETELLSGIRQHSKDEIYGSISPLLMQQRYDELHVSHRQAHRLLAKKDKAMKMIQCDLEVLRGKYDSMCDDYRSEQRRLESLCTRYLHMQQKKKQQICILKETLGYASECILHAQITIESCSRGTAIDEQHLDMFNQNFKFFLRALRHCCCLRKLQALQQQEGQDKVEEGQQGEQLPSCEELSTKALASSKDRTQLEVGQSKWRNRKRHKH